MIFQASCRSIYHLWFAGGRSDRIVGKVIPLPMRPMEWHSWVVHQGILQGYGKPILPVWRGGKGKHTYLLKVRKAVLFASNPADINNHGLPWYGYRPISGPMILDVINDQLPFKNTPHFGAKKEEDILTERKWKCWAARTPIFYMMFVCRKSLTGQGFGGYVHQVYLESMPLLKQKMFLPLRLDQNDRWSGKPIWSPGLGYDKSQIKYELYG